MSLLRPSRFWERLGAAHQAELARHGFEEIKRRQALRYFTWRWSWAALRRSEQLRFLLSHTGALTWLRCALGPAQLQAAAWQGTSWTVPDRWLYTFAVRLLWCYAAAHDRLGVLDLREPMVGSPLPVYWQGRLISQDLANSALETTAIARALAGSEPKHILEVGAGYGRSAYVLLSLFPSATYTIVDIEPAIDISQWYLTQLFPTARLQFLRPDAVHQIADGSVDLALSISSLQEMTPEQVLGYLELFDRVASGGTVFLKQWDEWHNPDDNLRLRFADYPIPARWARLFWAPSPVQSRFRQAAWRVPAPRGTRSEP